VAGIKKPTPCYPPNLHRYLSKTFVFAWFFFLIPRILTSFLIPDREPAIWAERKVL